MRQVIAFLALISLTGCMGTLATDQLLPERSFSTSEMSGLAVLSMEAENGKGDYLLTLVPYDIEQDRLGPIKSTLPSGKKIDLRLKIFLNRDPLTRGNQPEVQYSVVPAQAGDYVVAWLENDSSNAQTSFNLKSAVCHIAPGRVTYLGHFTTRFEKEGWFISPKLSLLHSLNNSEAETYLRKNFPNIVFDVLNSCNWKTVSFKQSAASMWKFVPYRN